MVTASIIIHMSQTNSSIKHTSNNMCVTLKPDLSQNINNKYKKKIDVAMYIGKYIINWIKMILI